MPTLLSLLSLLACYLTLEQMAPLFILIYCSGCSTTSISTTIGTEVAGFYSDYLSGGGQSVLINGPQKHLCDDSNNIIIADTNNNDLRKFNVAFNKLASIEDRRKIVNTMFNFYNCINRFF